MKFVLVLISRNQWAPKKVGGLMIDEPITDPIIKFKIWYYNGALDIIQIELNERFGNDEAKLLKNLSFVSKKKRFLEVTSSSKSIPKYVFKIVCRVYSTFLHHENLIEEYLQFC